MSASLKLLESLAVFVCGTLALAFAIDWITGYLGYRPGLFCWALMLIMTLAYGVGLVLTSIGVIAWAFTFFRNEKPALLALGGLMLVFLPQVMPHYLGRDCVFTP